MGKINEQVLRAPIKIKDTDDDTSESRLYIAREIKTKFEESKEAFDRWITSVMKIQANFKDLTEGKRLKHDDSGDTEDRGREHQEMTMVPPLMPKVSNLKSLKPQCPS